jgi:hypothetical protein
MASFFKHCLSLSSCDESFSGTGKITFNIRHPSVLFVIANCSFHCQYNFIYMDINLSF